MEKPDIKINSGEFKSFVKHTKRLWLVRVKFLENGLYLLCNVLTAVSLDTQLAFGAFCLSA